MRGKSCSVTLDEVDLHPLSSIASFTIDLKAVVVRLGDSFPCDLDIVAANHICSRRSHLDGEGSCTFECHDLGSPGSRGAGCRSCAVAPCRIDYAVGASKSPERPWSKIIPLCEGIGPRTEVGRGVDHHTDDDEC